MKEQSFGALFKQSSFARWKCDVQYLSPSKYPLPVLMDPNIDEKQRPQFYGLKYDPPSKIWGRVPNVIKVKMLDGEYEGLGLVEHANIQNIRTKLLAVLERTGSETSSVRPNLLGIPETVSNEKCIVKPNFYSRGGHITVDKRLPVLGRLMQRVDTGYTVNVAGNYAHLPLFEIPRHCQFTMEDVVRKRVFKFFIKETIIDGPAKKPRIILSFYDS
jgi:hypothetical protein